MTNLRALLSSNIKKRRSVLGISQAVLAQRVGTSTHYIAQIEQENKFPSAEMLERIAIGLEYDSIELFSIGPFPEEAIKQFLEGVKADFIATNYSIERRIENLINSNKY
ncbi:MAG: helix-turn-helix domain-containing protein [Treponema sp.]|nr:helix-turn-helix domain-containing protein [Treponema sp.]